MRLIEFASAEEQIALWKLVSDTVWQSLQTQQRQQAEQKRRQKLRKPKSSAARKKPVVMPPVPLPPKAAPVQKSLTQTSARQQAVRTPAMLSQRQATPPAAYGQQQANVATGKAGVQTALAGQKTLDVRGQAA